MLVRLPKGTWIESTLIRSLNLDLGPHDAPGSRDVVITLSESPPARWRVTFDTAEKAQTWADEFATWVNASHQPASPAP